MLIQSYLSHVKIEYSFDIHVNDSNILIPKNIIQPLVENSIKHGLLEQDYSNAAIKSGKIQVEIRQQENYVLISVKDNGIGMTPEIYQKYFHCKNDLSKYFDDDIEHIGIFNVLMRLNYLYQNNYKIRVENNYGAGLYIELQLPYPLPQTTTTRFSFPKQL